MATCARKRLLKKVEHAFTDLHSERTAMDQTNLGKITNTSERGLDAAATLAKRQLERAIDVVEQIGHPGDSVLIAAVLQAIAINHAALPGHAASARAEYEAMTQAVIRR